MASPPFNLDINEPTDTFTRSAFPANERTFRDNVNSYLNTEHDLSTGYHAFQELTTSAKGALTTPPNGMIVYDTTLKQLQMNTGTAGSPTWTAMMSSTLFPITNAVGASTFTAVLTGTWYESGSAGGALTVTLPNTSGLPVGWYSGFENTGGNVITVTVNGGASETFRLPNLPTSITLYAADYENLIVSWDGSEWCIISATPATWALLGSGSTHLVSILAPGTGSVTILTARCKITGTGGGGGGSGSNSGGTQIYGGGAGASFITWLTGLIPGKTLTTSIGAGGTGGGTTTNSGGTGGNTAISSGTQTITTTTATGGNGATYNVSGGTGAVATGGTANTILEISNGGGTGIGGISAPVGPYGDGGSASLNGAAIPAAFGGGTVASQTGYPGILIVEWL